MSRRHDVRTVDASPKLSRDAVVATSRAFSEVLSETVSSLFTHSILTASNDHMKGLVQ